MLTLTGLSAGKPCLMASSTSVVVCTRMYSNLFHNVAGTMTYVFVQLQAIFKAKLVKFFRACETVKR